MKRLKLHGSKKVALLDDEDYTTAMEYAEGAGHSWYVQSDPRTRGIAYAVCVRPGSRNRVLNLHRLVLGITDPKVWINFRNGNRFDCRKSNLVISDPQNTAAGARKQPFRSSKYKGVSWNKEHQKWTAQVRVNYVLKHLGRFKSERRAAKVYDEAAYAAFGDSARLNFGRMAEAS